MMGEDRGAFVSLLMSVGHAPLRRIADPLKAMRDLVREFRKASGGDIPCALSENGSSLQRPAPLHVTN